MKHSRKLLAEFLGTAFLLCAILGSGIMGENLSAGNAAIALLANSIATGAALIVLILVFAPISGAQFNPAVTLWLVLSKKMSAHESLFYITFQIMGAIVGVWMAHLMFGLPLITASQHVRTGMAQWISEIIATFGLIMTIWGCRNYSTSIIAFAVGSYITGAYWFTSSTSFANPAVTLARSMTNTFSGIRPVDVLPFIAAQIVGVLLATVILKWFEGDKK